MPIVLIRKSLNYLVPDVHFNSEKLSPRIHTPELGSIQFLFKTSFYYTNRFIVGKCETLVYSLSAIPCSLSLHVKVVKVKFARCRSTEATVGSTVT